VLWTEQLYWATASSEPRNEPPVPLLDFGDHCYYNDFVHRILTDGDIAHRTVFSAASSGEVAAAARAGIGLAVLSERYITDGLMIWDPPVQLEPLPVVSQVIRMVPGERSQAVEALVDTIRAELTQGRVAA